MLAEGLLGLFPTGEERLEACLGDVGQFGACIGGSGAEPVGGVLQGSLGGGNLIVDLSLGGLDLRLAGLLVLDRGLGCTAKIKVSNRRLRRYQVHIFTSESGHYFDHFLFC